MPQPKPIAYSLLVKNCGLEPFHVPLWRFFSFFFNLSMMITDPGDGLLCVLKAFCFGL